jgi:hypothetical protein
MPLTKEERFRFCEWLKTEIQSGELIIVQMEKFSNIGMDLMVRKERVKVAAAKVILEDLLSVEENTI